MYEFLDRLVNVAIPRIRDFRGIQVKGFDGRGNFNMGIKEQIIFPEIDYDKIDKVRGLNITVTTTAKTDQEARALLSAFKFPFKIKGMYRGKKSIVNRNLKRLKLLISTLHVVQR